MHKLTVKLFDSSAAVRQRLLVAVWSLVLLSVFVLWLPRGAGLLLSGVSGFLLGIGQLFGLLATFFALTQFMLMGRIYWIERAFGLDRLAAYHRLNGYAAITLILLHPVLVVSSYSVQSGNNYLAQYLQTLRQQPYAIWALLAQILFVAVVASSIYISRRHLKFETWYFVHLMVYLAIVLVPFHQFAGGSSFAGSPLAGKYWLGLYAFVALNILVWRFGLLVYNFIKFDFRISRVERETPTVTSVYIKACGLQRLKFLPGQFIFVRIFTRKLWWQEHPFSVSWIPSADELRISVRSVGDYTAAIKNLKPGARLFVSGPFGRFTSAVAATDKRLFIAGGIGVTPLLPLADEAVRAGTDAVLLYGNKNAADVPLKSELDQLAAGGLFLRYVFSDENVRGAISGRIDGALIKKLVPDFKQRDIYICGPPPMLAGLIKEFEALGVKPQRLHYERFSLHNS